MLRESIIVDRLRHKGAVQVASFDFPQKGIADCVRLLVSVSTTTSWMPLLSPATRASKSVDAAKPCHVTNFSISISRSFSLFLVSFFASRCFNGLVSPPEKIRSQAQHRRLSDVSLLHVNSSAKRTYDASSHSWNSGNTVEPLSFRLSMGYIHAFSGAVYISPHIPCHRATGPDDSSPRDLTNRGQDFGPD